MTELQINALYSAARFKELCDYGAKLPSQQLAVLPPSALEQLGLSASMAGDHLQAVRLLSVLADRYPEVAIVQANLGVAHLRAGEYAQAQQRLQFAAEHRPQDAGIAFNLGLSFWQTDNPSEAAKALRRCLTLQPSHLEARLYLASCAVAQGDHLLAWQLSLALHPELKLGIAETERLAAVLMAVDRMEDAEQVYRTMLKESPEDIFSLINLVSILERSHRTSEAAALLDGVGGVAREHPRFLLQQARLLAASGEYDDVLRLCEQALLHPDGDPRQPSNLRVRSELCFEHAHALDRRGRYGEAHAAALEGNRLAREILRHAQGMQLDPAPLPSADPEMENHRDAATKLAGVAKVSGENPLWLVGFPRSGTTLLDRILDAHPRFQVMEERPAVDTMMQAIGSESADRIAAQHPLLREVYWRAVNERLVRQAGCTLVDKNPLNFVHVHALMQVFPASKWIFAIRHPCDVVLSCFMQNFRFSNAAVGFWSIGESARIYSKLMTEWLDRRERLQPQCFDLRYEELVAAPSEVLKKLFAFLQVDWDDSVLRYHERVPGTYISTPSYQQVAKPIYRDAVARWRRYEPWFDEAKPILEPLVVRLGYASLYGDENLS